MKDIVKIVILMCFLAIGKMSLAQCDFYREINVSASGFFAGGGYTQQYVVVSNETGLISYTNTTGAFDPVQPGQYLVYAVNYDGATPGVLSVGQPWSAVPTYAASTCMDIIGPFGSGAVNVCANICTDDPFSATSSGFFSGGSYTQTYVLIPYPTGGILGSNASGSFTNSDYTGDGVYVVYAVNTEDASVTSTLDVGDAWATAESSIDLNCAEKIGPYMVEVGSGLCLLSDTKFKLVGKLFNSYNNLSWNLQSSKKVEKYEIQYSGDGKKFKNIASTKELTFKHQNPSKKSVYRIKSIFEDNSTEYSNTIVLKREEKFSVSNIFPNPTNGDLTIKLNAEGERLMININNTLGQLVGQFDFQTTDGINELNIDISHLRDAMYYVSITDGNTKHIEKITKQ